MASWFPVAELLGPDLPIAIHRRASTGPGELAALAQELKITLSRSAIRPPYILVGHSFGALVIRQYAALYRDDVKGLLFVDGLPPTTTIAPTLLYKARWSVRLLQLLATFSAAGPLLRIATPYSQAVEWAFTELKKYPPVQQHSIHAEWNTPDFYRSASRILNTLPENLRAAQQINVPAEIPSIFLHSDYPAANGRHIDEAGHWIQIDRPSAVADAIRELAAMP